MQLHEHPVRKTDQGHRPKTSVLLPDKVNENEEDLERKGKVLKEGDQEMGEGFQAVVVQRLHESERDLVNA